MVVIIVRRKVDSSVMSFGTTSESGMAWAMVKKAVLMSARVLVVLAVVGMGFAWALMSRVVAVVEDGVTSVALGLLLEPGSRWRE